MGILKRMATVAFVLGIFSICFCAKIGAVNWNESVLRKSVQDAIDGEFRRNTELTVVMRNRTGRRVAYAALCRLRIKLLKMILRNELFLPADVCEYIRSGYLIPTSYEARILEEVARISQRKEVWKPIVRKLIKAYKSIRSGYLN